MQAAHENKTALVTGASGDIGLAIVEKLLSLGCTVFATYQRNRATLDALVKEHPYGNALHISSCDVTDTDDVQRLLGRTAGHASKLDILVNNAGLNKDAVFQQMTWDEFDQVIKTNLYGTFHVTQASMRLLRAAKQASVINLSSVAGLAGSAGQTNYSAAKAAIGGLTRSLARELSTKGIRVNAVAPGLVDSAMVKRVPRNLVRQALDAIAVKRLGAVQEVANVVAFLAGDEASYIIGQTIAVDGGLVLR